MLVKLFISFLKIGAFSFGGGYAMVPLIQKEVVDTHGWLSDSQLLDILAISQMTPGPIAVNSATYVGYKIDGVFGALISTGGVVLPSFAFILMVGILLKRLLPAGLVEGIFYGIRPVVVALILSAALTLVPGSFIDLTSILIFGIVLMVIHFWKLDPLLALVGSGLLGILIY